MMLFFIFRKQSTIGAKLSKDASVAAGTSKVGLADPNLTWTAFEPGLAAIPAWLAFDPGLADFHPGLAVFCRKGESWPSRLYVGLADIF